MNDVAAIAIKNGAEVVRNPATTICSIVLIGGPQHIVIDDNNAIGYNYE